MRKITKITSILLILVSLLTLCSGCMKSDTVVTLYVGVPWAEDSETYQKVQLAVEDSNEFTSGDYVRLELVTYTDDEAGKTDILKKMKNGNIALLFYKRDEFVDPYLDADTGMLASLTEIQAVYPSCFEDAKDFVIDTATDSDGVTHMLPLMGTYQGVFFNEKIFLDNGLTIPKTWEQFNAVIDTLIAKGITPVAGGFADGGMTYWMDELILMEGGVAEHSYVPKYGVVNSWARAINDFKGLYTKGTFNSDCMTKTHAEAVDMFNSGKAAMIVCNSKDVVTESADKDNMGVFSLPVAATGKKTIGDIICDFDTGIYMNSQFFTKRSEVIDTMVLFVVDYLNALCDEDYDTGDIIAPEWGYDAYGEDWTLPGNPYTIGVEEIVYNEWGDIIEGVKGSSEPEEIEASDTLRSSVFNMMENVSEAGRSLSTEFLTFDYFIDLVKNYIKNGGDVDQLLTNATAKEVEAHKALSGEADK